jgi:hypothetical protein
MRRRLSAGVCAPPSRAKHGPTVADRAARAISSARWAQRAGDDELLEWAGLPAFDATDVGEQPGMLFDLEAERRRAVSGGAVDHLTPARAGSAVGPRG